MKKISGIIIAKNEEKMIGEALDSISFCDELIVVDSGSTDSTKKIAEEKGAKIYEINSNDFSEMRNLGLEKSSSEWILYIDADERADSRLQEEVKKTVSESSAYSAFYLKRKNYYFGNNLWPKIEKLERFFKKNKLKTWTGKVHESPVIQGDVGELDGYLLHFTHRDLDSMVNKTMEWSETEAILRYNANHPKVTWWRISKSYDYRIFRFLCCAKGI